MDKYTQILEGNDKVKKINLGIIQSSEILSKDDLRDFLIVSTNLVHTYLSEDQLQDAYNMGTKKYNGTSLEYRRINPYPSYEKVQKEFYRDIPDNVELSNPVTKLYELAKLAFWANKTTKMVCLGEKRQIKNSISSIDFHKLNDYYEEIMNGEFEAEKRLVHENEEFQKNYIKYSQIMKAEEICYLIKSICIKNIINQLMNSDKPLNIKAGTYRDDNYNIVFGMDFPGEINGPFQFHLEDDGDKVFGEEQEKDLNLFSDSETTKKMKKTFNLKELSSNNQDIQDLQNKISMLNSDIERHKANISNGIIEPSQFAKIEPSQFAKIEPSQFASIVLDSKLSIYEKELHNEIVENLVKNKTIAVQQGNNLDIKASVESLVQYMLNNNIVNGRDEVKIIKIPAGKTLKNAVNIDVGKLKGIYINNESTIINANERLAEKSTCSILSKLGFYVPNSIIKNADIVYGNKIIESKYGLVLAREIESSRLFDFANEQRNGKSLLELDLTDEEIERFGLQEAYQKREESIEKSKQIIESNIFEKDNKNICIVQNFVPYGSYIAYALGCPYYVSVQEHINGRGATFAITSNPNIGKGTLPDSVIKFGNILRNQQGDGVFVKDDHTMIVAGGPKNKEFSLYEAFSSDIARKKIIGEIKQAFGLQLLPEEENRFADEYYEKKFEIGEKGGIENGR